MARGWSSPISTAERAGMLDGNVKLEILYSNVDGLIANSKELEFKDHIKESVP